MKTFYLHIDLGDLIYSLYFAKHLGIENYLLDTNKRLCKFDEAAYEFVATFLKQQSYIESVEKYNHQQFDLDYAKHPEDLPVKIGTNLVEYHSSKFNIDWKSVSGPWLTSSSLNFDKKIVINRTSRYHGNYLMYHDFLKHVNIKDCLFVGLENEWKTFCREFKKPIDFFHVSDCLDLASAINGCDTFLGNQSLSCAIATGLGKNCIVEVGNDCANYIFNSKKMIYF